MNIINSISDKRMIVYAGIIIICIIVLGIAVYIHFFSTEKSTVSWIMPDNNSEAMEEEYENIKTNFNSLFNNSVRKSYRRRRECKEKRYRKRYCVYNVSN